MRKMGKDFFRPLGPVNLGLTAVTAGPEAVVNSKKYMNMQRNARVKGVVAAGGVPPMKKTSAKQALRFYLQKQAGSTTFAQGMKSLPGALALGAGLAAGGLLAAGGAKGVGGIFQSFQSKRMFEELKRRYPEINRNKKSREYFDLIVAYAPSLMRHPAAIGDFLRRQLEYPMSSVEFIKQLADLEGAVAKTESYSAATRFGQEVTKGGSGVVVPLSEGAQNQYQPGSSSSWSR